jgi:hypothetical protein
VCVYVFFKLDNVVTIKKYMTITPMTTIDIGDGMQMTITLYVPTCILPEYWHRHGLSRKDIDHIVSYIPTKMLWICALAFNIRCPWYSLRVSASSIFAVTMSSKAVAVDLLLSHTQIKVSDVDTLETQSPDSFDHIPPIPMHSIDDGSFATISSGIMDDLLPAVLMDEDNVIPILPIMYQFMNRYWVPIGIEGDRICCNAVMLHTEYMKNTSNVRMGITHAPRLGMYNSTLYCLTDECVLFQRVVST